MSLRVTVELVPFGDETQKKVIDRITISRQTPTGNPCDYDVTLESTGQKTIVYSHYYHDGALVLAKAALKELVNDQTI